MQNETRADYEAMRTRAIYFNYDRGKITHIVEEEKYSKILDKFLRKILEL